MVCISVFHIGIHYGITKSRWLIHALPLLLTLFLNLWSWPSHLKSTTDSSAYLYNPIALSVLFPVISFLKCISEALNKSKHNSKKAITRAGVVVQWVNEACETPAFHMGFTESECCLPIQPPSNPQHVSHQATWESPDLEALGGWTRMWTTFVPNSMSHSVTVF